MRYLNKFIGAGLVFVALLLSLMFYLVRFVSLSFAQENPDIAYMRLPILLLVYLMLLMLIAAILIAAYLLFKSTSENIFSIRSVQGLYRMGHCFSIASIANFSIIIYSFSQLGEEVGILGVYLIAACAVVLIATMVMYFIANLFKRAVEFKEENEMTV